MLCDGWRGTPGLARACPAVPGYMPGQFVPVWVPPALGVVGPPDPAGADDAAGVGLAALTTATPPTARRPVARIAVAMVRRRPLRMVRDADPAPSGIELSIGDVVGPSVDKGTSFTMVLSV